MILIFTSAGEDRPLYRRDFFNTCCAPIGTHLLFGYEEKWLADNLKKPEDLARVKGQNALIIFCEKNLLYDASNPSNGLYFKYHPIRKVKIVDAISEHDSATFELELREFFSYNEYQGNSFEEIMKKFHEYVVTSEDQPTPSKPENKGKGRFVREESEWGRYGTNWHALINHLRKLEGLKRSYFLSAQAKNDFGKATGFLFPQYARQKDIITYDLRSGGRYEISLFVIPGKDAAQRYPTLEITQPIASISGPFIRQRSPGWQADFVVYCKRSFEQERCLISLKIPSGDPSIVESPDMQALIWLKTSRWLPYITILSLTVGIFLGSLSPDLVKDTASSIGVNPFGLFLDHPLSSTWILRLLGYALFSVGAFLAVRKMPIKF